MQNQIRQAQNRHYKVCLFGDSMTGPLKNNMGRQFFNFAITAMSSKSLVDQLKILLDYHVECETAIIAIGTNDAFYDVNDETFIQLMEKAVDLLQSMGVAHIILLPAFYSSLAASQNPFRAGTIARVEEINELLRQVALTKSVYFAKAEVQVLFENQELKSELSSDGVHFNAMGLRVYKKVLFELISKKS